VTSPVAGSPSGSDDWRFWLGLGLGALPLVLMWLFGFTQCPLVPMGDYTCHDPNQGPGGWFFVVAIGVYLLDALVTLVCLFFRRVRPVAWGLLPMLVIGPILGVIGFYAISTARHPHPTSLSSAPPLTHWP
jgi:hypothetical protein